MGFTKGGAKAPTKKATEKVVKATSDEPTEFVIDPKVSYEFVLVDTTSPSTTIPRKIKIWDEENKKVRMARYSSVEDSIWEDEQNEVIPEELDIEFVKTKLTLQGSTQAPLIKYLMAHDWIQGKSVINPENRRGASTYRLIDRNAGVKTQLDLQKAIAKATAIVEGADLDKLEVFLLSTFGFKPSELKGVSESSYEEAIELEAYKMAKAYPSLFVDGFENPKHAYKAVIIEAFAKGLLSDAEDGLVTRVDTGAVVLEFDEEKYSGKADDALVDFVIAGADGKKLFSELESQLAG